MKNCKRRMELLEAVVSPVAGMLIQFVVYCLMGVRLRDVSAAFIVVMWVLLSAAVSMGLERLQYGKGTGLGV